ncbi:MAG: glycosyltransferase, partial [Pedobacter sp.]
FDKKYILFLSRVHPKKGIDLLVKSFADTVINHNLDLVICGPCESSYKTQLLNEVNLNARGRIHFCGNVRGDAKWGAIYGCEVFILPSHQENFGIAIVEALACGKAVLISDKVNIWREIVEAGAGCVEPDTRKGVDQLLLNWISRSPKDREIMAQNAFQVYSKNFFIEKTANSLLHLISNLIK